MIRLIAFAVALCCASAAVAQSYPARPIRLILGASPGGGLDVVARAMAQRFQEVSGQPLVIEYKPGADEQIGTAALANATPDGYTALLVGPSFAINPSLYTKLPYDTARQFIPVTRLITTPFVFLVNPDVPAKNMQELVDVAKARPGVLNYGTIGAASPQGLTMEWFKRLAQIDIVPVPYKGVGPALTALISGEVQTMAAGLAAGMAQVQGGKLRALAVTSAKRSAVAPDVPTVAEAGYPGFDVFTWYGIMLPAGTPPAIVAKLNSDLMEVLSAPDVRARFIANGVESAPLPPAEFAQFIKANSELWAGIIKQAGVKPE